MKKLLLGLIALPLVTVLPAGCAEQGAISSPGADATTQQQTINSNDSLRTDHPNTYTVVEGDTLWAIAGRFLNEPWLWKDLWQANPEIKNPNLIYPGDTIKVVYVDGKPHLTVDRGAANKDPSNCSNEPTEKVGADGVVKMSPKCRALPLDLTIPTISLETLAPFLSNNKVAAKNELDNAPRIVDGDSGRVVGGEGDEMFARGHFKADMPVYNISRVGKTYTDPLTNEVLGLEIKNIGSARILTPSKNISKIELIRTSTEVKVGDILLPVQEEKVESVFMPQAPEKDVRGFILNVPNSVSDIGQYDTVLLSKGERDGLKPGSVLAIYKTGDTVRDPKTLESLKMPSEKAGLLLVFRTFDKMSYGLVMQAERPLAVGDEVRNP